MEGGGTNSNDISNEKKKQCTISKELSEEQLFQKQIIIISENFFY